MGLHGKEFVCNARDLVPRFNEERDGYPLQYSCYLGNPTDKGDWQATDHGVAESDMTE